MISVTLGISMPDIKHFESGGRANDPNSGWVECFYPYHHAPSSKFVKVKGSLDDFEFDVREGVNMVKRKFYLD